MRLWGMRTIGTVFHLSYLSLYINHFFFLSCFQEKHYDSFETNPLIGGFAVVIGREREQQNLLAARQSVLMEQQNILMAQQNILTEQQSVLMAQHNILMGQQKILTEQQNALAAQQKIHTEQQNVADKQPMEMTGQKKVQEHAEQQHSSSANPAMQQSSSEEEPWKIKKVLQDFDLTLRLLVAPSLARNFMLPVLNATDYEIEKGIDLEIWDVDTDTKHSLFFTKKSNAYILVNNWINDFVCRRCLHKGDEIGLRWNPTRNCFDFSVLRRHQSG